MSRRPTQAECAQFDASAKDRAFFSDALDMGETAEGRFASLF